MRKENFKPFLNWISHRPDLRGGALICLLLVGSIFGETVQAQEPTFSASVSTQKVPRHTVFEVYFELQNANGVSFQPPSFSGFRVVGGPAMGSRMMNINGVVSQSQSWSDSLLATDEGRFEIGQASVIAGQKKLTSRPVIVEVVPAATGGGTGSNADLREPVLLRAETQAENYYPGQQIILNYRLLFRENVQTVSTMAEDDYADFFIQTFSDISREATYETIQGVQFTSRIVKSLALFAHQSGTYMLDPLVMNVGINAPFPGSQGFFTMRRIQDVQVASEPLTISILPLPVPAPSTFHGAVGQYQINLVPGEKHITTDDAITFRLDITGNGDARRWDAPHPIVDGEADIYDPKILEDKVIDQRNQVTHFRSVAYQILPTVPGVYQVFVPFTFFDPQLRQYVTIASDTISFEVAQGSLTHNETRTIEQMEQDVPSLMRVRRVHLNDRFWASFPHLFLLGLAFSGVCLGLVVTLKRNSTNQLSESEKRRSLAAGDALKQLRLLESEGEIGPPSVFFERSTAIYYRFLSDRFGIPPSEMDEAGLHSYLERDSIPDDVAAKIKNFFSQCLVVRYGGIPGGFSRAEMLHEIRQIIDRVNAP